MDLDSMSSGGCINLISAVTGEMKNMALSM